MKYIPLILLFSFFLLLMGVSYTCSCYEKAVLYGRDGLPEYISTLLPGEVCIDFASHDIDSGEIQFSFKVARDFNVFKEIKERAKCNLWQQVSTNELELKFRKRIQLGACYWHDCSFLCVKDMEHMNTHEEIQYKVIIQ